MRREPSVPGGRPACPAPGDVTKPSIARVYDYVLGGKDNFAVDREVGDRLIAEAPGIPAGARANRAFLGRAVRYLCAQGIRQFVDLGSGLPTQENVHQVAQRADRDAVTVYVDNDPTVLAYGRALMAVDPRTVMIDADIAEPASILRDPVLNGLVDLAQPVGLLLVSMLHFFPDDAHARSIVEEFAAALVPGSHLVISHARALPELARAAETYKSQAAPFTLRDHGQVTAFFGPLELIEPGVVPADEWRPDPPATVTPWGGPLKVQAAMLSGVARKPAPPR